MTDKMLADTSGNNSDKDNNGILYILAASAVFTALCRLFPLPFLDKMLLYQIRRLMFASIISYHGFPIDTSLLLPLCSKGKGCLYKIFVYPFIIIFILIWKVIRRILKMLFYFITIRDAAVAMGEIILLGHTVERCLLDGRISREPPEDRKFEKQYKKSVYKCRKCFEKALSGSDFRFIIHIFRSNVTAMLKLPKLAGVITAALGKSGSFGGGVDDLGDGSDTAEKTEFSRLQEKIVEVLKQDDTQSYIHNFDKRFDKLWGNRH